MDEAGLAQMMLECVPQYGVAATTMKGDGEVDDSTRQREDYGSEDPTVEIGVSDGLASSSTPWDTGIGTPSTMYMSL